jgi:hypothetical protein
MDRRKNKSKKGNKKNEFKCPQKINPKAKSREREMESIQTTYIDRVHTTLAFIF